MSEQAAAPAEEGPVADHVPESVAAGPPSSQQSMDRDATEATATAPSLAAPPTALDDLVAALEEGAAKMPAVAPAVKPDNLAKRAEEARGGQREAPPPPEVEEATITLSGRVAKKRRLFSDQTFRPGRDGKAAYAKSLAYAASKKKANGTCKFANCTAARHQQCEGYCASHKEHGRRCKEGNCFKPRGTHCEGLCVTCFRTKTGSFPKQHLCKVEGCPRKGWIKGYCSTHNKTIAAKKSKVASGGKKKNAKTKGGKAKAATKKGQLKSPAGVKSTAKEKVWTFAEIELLISLDELGGEIQVMAKKLPRWSVAQCHTKILDLRDRAVQGNLLQTLGFDDITTTLSKWPKNDLGMLLSLEEKQLADVTDEGERNKRIAEVIPRWDLEKCGFKTIVHRWAAHVRKGRREKIATTKVARTKRRAVTDGSLPTQTKAERRARDVAMEGNAQIAWPGPHFRPPAVYHAPAVYHPRASMVIPPVQMRGVTYVPAFAPYPPTNYMHPGPSAGAAAVADHRFSWIPVSTGAAMQPKEKASSKPALVDAKGTPEKTTAQKTTTASTESAEGLNDLVEQRTPPNASVDAAKGSSKLEKGGKDDATPSEAKIDEDFAEYLRNDPYLRSPRKLEDLVNE